MSVAGDLAPAGVFYPQREVLIMPEELLTPEEAAALLKVKVSTVKEWLRRGKLRGVRLAGKVWRVRPADLDAFVLAGEKPGDGEEVQPDR